VSSTANGRIELEGGYWVRLRPMTGNDLMALARIEEDLASALERFAAAAIEWSWEGAFLDQDWSVMRPALGEWQRTTREAALPPASGGS